MIRTRFTGTILSLGLLTAACSATDDTTAPATSPSSGLVDVPGGSLTPRSAATTPQPTTTGEQSDADPGPSLPNPTVAPVRMPESLNVVLTPILDVELPIALATRKGTTNIFIATKTGRILEIAVDGDSASVLRELLDIGPAVSSGNEQGLLGLTFSPSGTDLYLDYTDSSGATNVVGISMDGDEVDLASWRTLLVVDQPRSNHNGGAITFGPDGFLYIALGDGGGAGDPFQTGQDPASLLGAILRIEPMEDGYAIPSDNPFAEGGGAPEVFVYGVRNPWRFSFDDATGDLWIADVGQDSREELTVAYASNGAGSGANLGWSDVEGTAPFAASEPPSDSYIGPIHEYGRSDGCSITGGYVYRGQAIPELSGIYVFGDFCTSRLWGFASSESQGALGRFDLGPDITDRSLASFGEGPDGELYVLSFEGLLYRLDPG